ncbi:MAG: hypothetical protein ACJATL_000880 [Rickettsiales bacterium]|jgi:hypothetical protein
MYNKTHFSIHIKITCIEIRYLQQETVWLNQEKMAGLFGKTKSTVNEGELLEKHSMQKFGNSEFQQKATLLML